MQRDERDVEPADSGSGGRYFSWRVALLLGVIAVLVAATDRAARRENRAAAAAPASDVPVATTTAVSDAAATLVENTDASSAAGHCLAVVNVALDRNAQVRSSFESAAHAAETQGVGLGGIDVPPSDEGGYESSWGVHSAERFERFGGYTISAAGELEVDVLGAAVELPESDREAIRRACAGVTFER